MSDLRKALQTLRENIREKGRTVQQIGIRDNDNTRNAIAVLLDSEAALQSQTARAVPEGWMLVRQEWQPIMEEVDRRADKCCGLECDFTIQVEAEDYRAIDKAERTPPPAPQPDPSPDGGEHEIRADGSRVRKDRWEAGFRSIVTHTVGPRTEFEIDDIVELVRQKFTPAPDGGKVQACPRCKGDGRHVVGPASFPRTKICQLCKAAPTADGGEVELLPSVREYLQQGIDDATHCEDADQDHAFAKQLYDILNRPAPAADGGEVEPVGWLVERAGDGTFPRFCFGKSGAKKMLREVGLLPSATMRPVYTHPAQPRNDGGESDA